MCISMIRLFFYLNLCPTRIILASGSHSSCCVASFEANLLRLQTLPKAATRFKAAICFGANLKIQDTDVVSLYAYVILCRFAPYRSLIGLFSTVCDQSSSGELAVSELDSSGFSFVETRRIAIRASTKLTSPIRPKKTIPRPKLFQSTYRPRQSRNSPPNTIPIKPNRILIKLSKNFLNHINPARLRQRISAKHLHAFRTTATQTVVTHVVLVRLHDTLHRLLQTLQLSLAQIELEDAVLHRRPETQQHLTHPRAPFCVRY